MIIADFDSKDRTREIAEEYNCRIAKGGRPAKGRNEGVKLSKNGILFFLDSDTILEKNFLKDCINEFIKRDLDIAICYMRFSDRSISLKITERFCNFGIRMIARLYGVGTGFCIICKRELHDKINGFNEGVHILEDMDYVRRAILTRARYGILKSHYIILSPRRYIKEGPFKLTAKYTYAFFRSLVKGPMKKKRLNYEWAKYDD